jgi:hypothetical protein
MFAADEPATWLRHHVHARIVRGVQLHRRDLELRALRARHDARGGHDQDDPQFRVIHRGDPAVVSIQYRRFGVSRSGPVTTFSRTPPFFSIVLIDPMLLSSQVSSTWVRPNLSRAIASNCRRISVANPCRLNSGTTVYPM